MVTPIEIPLQEPTVELQVLLLVVIFAVAYALPSFAGLLAGGAPGRPRCAGSDAAPRRAATAGPPRPGLVAFVPEHHATVEPARADAATDRTARDARRTGEAA